MWRGVDRLNVMEQRLFLIKGVLKCRNPDKFEAIKEDILEQLSEDQDIER